MKDEYTKITRLLLSLDEVLIKVLPKDYEDVAKHYINSKIEFLKAVDEFIHLQIKRLEDTKKNLVEKPKKEKLEVE